MDKNRESQDPYKRWMTADQRKIDWNKLGDLEAANVIDKTDSAYESQSGYSPFSDTEECSSSAVLCSESEAIFQDHELGSDNDDLMKQCEYSQIPFKRAAYCENCYVLEKENRRLKKMLQEFKAQRSDGTLIDDGDGQRRWSSSESNKSRSLDKSFYPLRQFPTEDDEDVPVEVVPSLDIAGVEGSRISPESNDSRDPSNESRFKRVSKVVREKWKGLKEFSKNPFSNKSYPKGRTCPKSCGFDNFLNACGRACSEELCSEELCSKELCPKKLCSIKLAVFVYLSAIIDPLFPMQRSTEEKIVRDVLNKIYKESMKIHCSLFISHLVTGKVSFLVEKLRCDIKSDKDFDDFENAAKKYVETGKVGLAILVWEDWNHCVQIHNNLNSPEVKFYDVQRERYLTKEELAIDRLKRVRLYCFNIPRIQQFITRYCTFNSCLDENWKVE